MIQRSKVYAYITRNEQILVFRHVDFPEAGIQVPGGTLHQGELPERAVLREVVEETGLEAIRLESYLGCDEYHLQENEAEEIHLRHFYHLICEQDTPHTWQHYEHYRSDYQPEPILFEFYWLPKPAAIETLHPYYSAKIGQLLENPS